MASLSACTPEELKISALPNAPIHCLTRDESVGLAFIAEAGALSLFACVVTYGLIIRNIRYHARRTPGQWRLIKVPMDIYLLSVFTADIVIAIGGIISAKWVKDGKCQVGPSCSAQAICLSLGSITVAFNILAIAIHTFVMVWCNKGFHSTFVAWISVAFSWIFSTLYVATLGWRYRHEPNTIFRPTPYWCWFGKTYVIYRLLASYVWMWIALFVSLLIYIPLFFWGRGNITVGEKPWKFRIHPRGSVSDPAGARRRSALSMIAYPLVYSFVVLPLSVGRWIGFLQESHGDRKNHVPPGATIAVLTIFCLSGICNVFLFLTTRPNLLLFRRDFDTDHTPMTRVHVFKNVEDTQLASNPSFHSRSF